MKTIWIIMGLFLVGLGAGLALWFSHSPAGSGPGGTPRLEGGADSAESEGSRPPLRIGLIPERDIFEQRRRFRALADYLASRLARPVELVTANSYQAILEDFAERRVDAAFLGAFVAVLAIDRLGAEPLVRPVTEDGVNSYRGVIFVPDGSPIREVEDLAGRSIAMVKTTMAAEVFPMCQMVEHRLLTPPAVPPRIVWVGTHDQVADEVLAGRVEAGAIKDLRLNAFEKAHPEAKIRRLAISEAVPENGLILRADHADTLGPTLKEALVNMASDPAGRAALKTLGAARFEPCECRHYRPVFQMIYRLGGDWARLGVAGAPPWCACVGTPRPRESRTPGSSPDGR